MAPCPRQYTAFSHPDLKTLHTHFVCRLNKSLYGLKQAPRAWFSRFATYLHSLGFVGVKSDTSLFVFQRGSDTAYLLLYVDDIVLTASSPALLCRIISEFSRKDLGVLHHFLVCTFSPQAMVFFSLRSSTWWSFLIAQGCQSASLA